MRQYAGTGLDDTACIPMIFGIYGEFIILKLNWVILLEMGPDSACNERVYDCWDILGFFGSRFRGPIRVVL